MIIEIPIPAYDPQRLGRPWIGKVVMWVEAAGPSLQRGHWFGDDGGGELEIDASDGDLIKWGQRDLRSGTPACHWARVQGEHLIELTETDARKRWVETQFGNTAEGSQQWEPRVDSR